MIYYYICLPSIIYFFIKQNTKTTLNMLFITKVLQTPDIACSVGEAYGCKKNI